MQNIFNLFNKDRELFDDIMARINIDEHRIDQLEEFVRNVSTEGTMKLINHKRSTYFALGDNKFIAVKGGVEAADLYDDTLLNREGNPLGNNNSLEMFPMIEGKVPYQCLKSELAHEVDKAHGFLKAYLKNFNSLPNMPFPLALFEYPSDYSKGVHKILSKYVSSPVLSKVTKILEADSFAVGVFLYASTPLRVMDLKTEPKLCLPYWGQSKEQVVNSWCLQFVRSLLLGFVPASKWSIISGSCLSPQNMSLGGGWSDVDSLVSFADFKSENILIESIIYSFDQMCETIFIAIDRNNINQSMKNERKSLLKAQLLLFCGDLLQKESSKFKNEIDSNVKKVFLKSNLKELMNIQELLS